MSVRCLRTSRSGCCSSERAASNSRCHPRENPLVHRTIDSAMARGATAASHYALFGTCAYKQTGVIQAAAVQHLLNARPFATGFASPCSAFGHRQLLAHLESYGLSRLQRFY